MHIDFGVFSDLNGERWHGTSAPGLFIIDGKTEPLVKLEESFGVRRGYGNVINTRGGHLYPPYATRGPPRTCAIVSQHLPLGNAQTPSCWARSKNVSTTMSWAGLGTGSGGPLGPHSVGRRTKAL